MPRADKSREEAPQRQRILSDRLISSVAGVVCVFARESCVVCARVYVLPNVSSVSRARVSHHRHQHLSALGNVSFPTRIIARE
jgi:hypothetical protein